jgi:hypothetical protein
MFLYLNIFLSSLLYFQTPYLTVGSRSNISQYEYSYFLNADLGFSLAVRDG